MKDKELNLTDLIKMIYKNKILFFVVFILLSILSIFYVLQIEKTYKSSLIVNMPLQKGIETEYTIESLAQLRAPVLNTTLKLENDVLIEELILSQIKHEDESTFGVIEFITTKPDLDAVVKNKFVDYINNLDFLKTLTILEKEKNQDLINTANLEYENIQKQTQLIVSKNKEYEGTSSFISSVDIKEQLHNAKMNLKFSKPLIEVSYNVSPDKFKPSYAMLIVLSILFSFLLAFTFLILKVVFFDLMSTIKNEIE